MLNQMRQQIYYLISQEFEGDCSHEFQERLNNYEFIDAHHLNNLFEVVQENVNVYKIVKVHKNKGLNGKFKPNDIIYFDGGMISFFTKNENGEIDQIECFPTACIKKEQITNFFNESIDAKINDLIGLITKLKNGNIHKLPLDPKYDQFLSLFENIDKN